MSKSLITVKFRPLLLAKFKRVFSKQNSQSISGGSTKTIYTIKYRKYAKKFLSGTVMYAHITAKHCNTFHIQYLLRYAGKI